ncbi:RNA-splicing factor [Echria macrotheca]|uniref:Pre-mRNA-splicing factor CWC24 n=1 Tax=Echria macrotheca TaxID=438768 RepID=A0AAJ0FCI6_9PEZI|nr:RNA-splicing factor [Echria macrotheca]
MADTEKAPDTTAAAPAPVAIFKKRGAKGKANIRKRPATPPPASQDSDDDSDFSSSEDDSGRRVKRRKRNIGGSAVVTVSSKNKTSDAAESLSTTTIFQADRDAAAALDTARRDATKGSNWFDEDKDDAKLSAKELLGTTRAATGSSTDGTYKGLANRTSFIQRNPDAPTSGRSVGPVKAPTNIRTITITDMAPDVCKDYKQTGFCGFGDNCKFLHAREDYQHGWQLDKEWEKVTKGKKVLGGTVVASADRSTRKKQTEEEEADEAEEAMLEGIPFVCIICREDYKAPVVTRCGHYFCEACALKRYRRDPSCAACGAGTNGVFNSAKRVIREDAKEGYSFRLCNDAGLKEIEEGNGC